MTGGKAGRKEKVLHKLKGLHTRKTTTTEWLSPIVNLTPLIMSRSLTILLGKAWVTSGKEPRITAATLLR